MEGALIGMQAIVLNNAVVGRNCLIGAGAIVPEGRVIPDNSLVIGIGTAGVQLAHGDTLSFGGEVLRAPVKKDAPINMADIDSPYSADSTLRRMIDERGVSPLPAEPDTRLRLASND